MAVDHLLYLDLDLLSLAVALCHNHLCLAVEDMVVASADLQCLEAVDSAATSVAAVDLVDPQCLAVAVLAEALEDLLCSAAVEVLLGHLCMAEASEEASAVVEDLAAAVCMAVAADSAVVWVEIHSAVDVAVDVVDLAAIHFKVAV